MIYDVIVSIDIGLRGGIAFFETAEKDHPSGGLLSLHEMPAKEITVNMKKKNVTDLDRLKFLLERPQLHGDKALVVFEDVHAFPGQGVVAVGSLLESKGIIRGLAKGLGYDECAISPKTWQKYFGIVPSKDMKGDTVSKTKALRKKWLKSTSMSFAKEKFPEWADKITSDGLSDAVLIGKWYLDNYPDLF